MKTLKISEDLVNYREGLCTQEEFIKKWRLSELSKELRSHIWKYRSDYGGSKDSNEPCYIPDVALIGWGWNQVKGTKPSGEFKLVNVEIDCEHFDEKWYVENEETFTQIIQRWALDCDMEDIKVEWITNYSDEFEVSIDCWIKVK